MANSGISSSEDAMSTLALLSLFCLFSFAAVCIAPLPSSFPFAHIYLRIFTGFLAAGSLWCTFRELRSASQQLTWRKFGSMLWPLLLVGLAAWLRFRNLTVIDTWQDEDHHLSASLVRDNLVALAASNHQAPLTYFQSYLTMKSGGVSLFTARLVPAVLGSIAVIPFYRLLKNFVRAESALLGAIFFLGNTLLWSLSQEGRPYMAAVFLLVSGLHLWVEFFRDPSKRYLLVAFAVSQAALFVTLTMQPQFAFGFYLIPLVIFSFLGNRMHLKEFFVAVFLAGIVALPVMITAALELPEEPQIQPFASGFFVIYWPTMLKSVLDSLGPLIWAAPLIPIPLFLKNRDARPDALAKSLLALALIYPILFYFFFEAVLSTPIAPRYVTFLVVFYIFALTYSLDRLAPVNGFKYAAFGCATLFMMHSVSAESLKVREPGWRQFFEFVAKNEQTLGIGAVLDMQEDWRFPTQGFRGVYTYGELIRGRLSLRSHSDRAASAPGDLIQRLIDKPEAKFAYLYLPATSPENLLYNLNFSESPERKIFAFEGAKAIRVEAKKGDLPSAIREILQTAADLDPRVARTVAYSELMSGLYALEARCRRAMEHKARIPEPKQNYGQQKTMAYLNKIISERCAKLSVHRQVSSQP